MIPVGADWEKPSLGATTRLGSGPWLAQLSPIDGSTVQRVRTMTLDEIAMATNSLRPLSAGGFEGAQARLMAALGPLEPELRESLQLETAYVTADCQELTLALLDFARDFKPLITASSGPTGSYGWPGGARSFELQRAPWGVIAMVLPRNAFALLAVTCILNALAAGNSVIVRAPTQCARTAGLLADVLQKAGLDRHVAVAVAPAKEFIGCVLELGCVRLLHYMGSSGHIADLLSRCFAAGIGLVADGEGNVLAYVGEEAEVAPTAQVLVRASTRYSGQTCTSINGVVAHPAVYEGLRDLVQSELASLRCGDPRAEDVKVGPLFDVAQVRSCLERMEHSGGHILVGGRAEDTLLLPSLVDRPNPACDLVREGLFGPALWIMPGDAGVFREIWQLNRYPLAAAVFGRSDWAPTLPNLARLTVDGDPSFEYGHAPWGGYPSAGVNPVSPWIDKYLRAVQVDRPAREAL